MDSTFQGPKTNYEYAESCLLVREFDTEITNDTGIEIAGSKRPLLKFQLVHPYQPCHRQCLPPPQSFLQQNPKYVLDLPLVPRGEP